MNPGDIALYAERYRREGPYIALIIELVGRGTSHDGQAYSRYNALIYGKIKEYYAFDNGPDLRILP